MRELLAMPRMRLFYLGDTLNNIGDLALWLAAGIWVKELTGSTAQAGFSFLCLTIGTLLSPLTGILVDKLPRRPLLMVVNAATGLLVLSLTFVHDASHVWLVFMVMFLYGLSDSICVAAESALLPQLVPKELLADANGLSQALSQGQRLITPAIGVGLLSLLGGGAVAVLDAATFGASLSCWYFIRVDERPPTRAQQHWTRETVAGFAFLYRTPVLRQLTTVLTAGLLVVGFFETLGIAIATVGLHHSPSWTGVLITEAGATGIIGGLSASALMKRTGPGRLVAVGLGVAATSTLLFAVGNDVVVLAGGLLFGLAVPLIVVGSLTAVQLNTPSELMGRVSGADNFLVTGGQSLGIATGAALISVLFYRDLCYTAAGVLAVCAVYLVTRKEQRPVRAEPSADEVCPEIDTLRN